MSRYVLDSYALIAWHKHEAASLRVRQLVANSANDFWLSVVNMGEVYYRTAREFDEDVAHDAWRWMINLPVRIIDVNQSLTHEAARLKATYPISYADCFAAALARRLAATVITGDREFLALERDGVVGLTWIERR
jgi:ribonuclease VapC